MSASDLRERIRSRAAKVGVVGCGYVGLPLSQAFADAGYTVVGIDVDARRVDALNRGVSHILDVPAETVKRNTAAGRFSATTDLAAARALDVIFISVPTPFDKAKQPDLSFIVAAARGIAPALRADQLIVLESTTYPGTTDEVLRPILEAGGLVAGRDFYLAFSPERIDPGNKTYKIHNTPKVVGGVDPESTKLAVFVLEQIVTAGGVHAVSSARAAELTKLLENTFRAVNIALVNELAMLTDRMDIDLWEVIDAAATKPYGFVPFYPGPGVGGHCLATGEWVYVREGRRAGPRTVDELWRFAVARRSVTRIGDMEIVRNPGLDALGIGVDGPAAWEPVTHMARRLFRGELVTITTTDGRVIVVTDRHPLLVVANGVMTRMARDIRPGDLLPSFAESGLASPNGDPCIDLIPHLSAAQRERTRVRIAEGSWAAFGDALRARFGPTRTHDWLRTDQIPLDAYLELESIGGRAPTRDTLELWIGRGPGCSRFPAITQLTPDVARLVGYYATEGCISVDAKSSRVRFTLHAEERETHSDLVRLLDGLRLRHSTSRDAVCNNVHVKVSSALFAAFLRDALGCGVGSYDAAVPEVLLGASEEHRLALLTGLMRGDGSVYARSGPRRYRKNGREYIHRNAAASLSFWTSSVTLEQQVLFLLQSLGIRSSIQRRRRQPGADIHILGADSVMRLRSLFVDAKRERLERCIDSKRRLPRSRGVLMAAGQSVVAVKSVDRRAAEVTVFSLETTVTHTFATGQGIFVHNCIPVDPYYLSWKAREYDFHTKFIELAAETNLEMPLFTAGRIQRLLNEHGRSMKDANILVLGATFKPDIDDARNSAAMRVMEALRAEGACLAYHDPFATRITLADRLYEPEPRTAFESVELTPARLAQADCVAILVAHSAVDYSAVLQHAPLVFDAVNATRGRGAKATVERL